MEWKNPKLMTEPGASRTKIVVISMADAADRRRRFEERAREARVPWTFHTASTSLHPALSYDEKSAIVAKGRPLRSGEIGVYSSHYELWSNLQTDDADQYVVLEDDVIVDWTFLSKLAQADLGGMGIDYLRLYYKFPIRAAVVKEDFLERARSIVELDGTAFGCQGYVVTKAGARILCDHCQAVSRPIDDEMERTWVHGLRNLSVFPFPVIEESGPSTIGNTRFETFAVPSDLRFKRFVTHRWERWRRDVSVIMRRFQRLRARR